MNRPPLLCTCALLLAAPAQGDPGTLPDPLPSASLAWGAVLPPADEPLPAGRPAPAAEPGALDRWWFVIDFSLWFPGISGDVGARGFVTHVNESFIDLLDNTDSLIGLAGNFSFGRGKVGGYVNGFWSRMGSEVADPAGTIDVTTDMGLMGFGASYEVGRWPMEYTARAESPARDLTVNAMVGGRFTSVSIDIDHPVLPDRSESHGWVDPMLGGAVLVPFAPDWSMNARGEIGGFGAASDFAWSAALLFSWDFHIKDLPSSLQFGYIAVGDDYSTGSGANQLVWDTILHGPVLNFEIRF